MPYYMLQVGYTSEAWATMAKHPQDRAEAVRPAIESLGGSVEGAWICFGEYDLVAIVQFPDNVASAAFSIAAAGAGALSTIKTTPLMTMDEGVEAMNQAAGTGLKPPS
ncbi:MAG: GYD domain-containing protein [Acidimicrobiia bacterium]